MVLFKLKRHAEVSIPADLRKQLNLEEGDDMEVGATAAGILLKPVSVVEHSLDWWPGLLKN